MTEPFDVAAIEAVTLDFGNTLVPVDRAGLDRVVEATAAWLAQVTGVAQMDVIATWEEERERQWREDVPAFRETDLVIRVARVLARLRGMEPPAGDVPWDDADAASRSTTDELAAALRVYTEAFAELPPSPDAGEVLATLDARGYRLAILSNWPLAASIDHYVERHGWSEHLVAIVVSERVGTIKPQPGMFSAAEELLAVPASAILHVGDDWAADVVGALQAGWRTAYLRSRPADSPLPASVRTGPGPDLEIECLADLLEALPGKATDALALPTGIVASRP
jgi:HAD superfamily hydrolase (TIGR01549 family)